jgi:hypothetical protein
MNLRRLLALVAWLGVLVGTATAQPSSHLGEVDRCDVFSTHISCAGWAVGPGDDRLAKVEVILGADTLRASSVALADRPDVGAYLKQEDSSKKSGWEVEARLPYLLAAGDYSLHLRGTYHSGQTIEFSGPANPFQLRIPQASLYRVLAALLLGIAALGMLTASRSAALVARRRDLHVAPAHIACGYIVFAFVGLVSMGLTGSSIDIALRQLSGPQKRIPDVGVVMGNYARVLGVGREIRSDEWAAFTPLAIAQVNHEPRFPVENKNIGPDGQNMLVVGMAGVPVAHLSALAKPATWGFFVLDLRRALAWYWWLPLFGCLFAVWGVMSVLAPGQWRMNLAIASIFVSSAYVVAWSNWPAYAVLFPATAFSVFFSLFRTRSLAGVAVLGVALGLCIAGFVLVLYPPWQVPLGYLFLFLTAGVVLRDRLWSQVSRIQLAGLAVAAIVAGLILASWWVDARVAVQALVSTVYPGLRRVPGGGMQLWELCRGFLNFHTLYYENAASGNASESSSFLYLFPVLFAAYGIQLFRRSAPSGPELAVMAFCICVVWYQFFGFSAGISQWTLWSRTSQTRSDLALGLASLLLCGLSYSARASGAGNYQLRKPEAIAVAGLWALAVVWAVLQTPDTVIGKLTNSTIWFGIFALTFALSYWLLAQKRTFLVAYLAVSLVISLPFNPVTLAPSHLAVHPEIKKHGNGPESRVLVIREYIKGMYLVAAGFPVANGPSYYPQRSIWHRLDPDASQLGTTNRFSHLMYFPRKAVQGKPYQIELMQTDIIGIFFDPERFDFRLSGAEQVLAPVDVDLSRNVTLEVIATDPHFVLYKVR